jgi:hypothetical protein
MGFGQLFEDGKAADLAPYIGRHQTAGFNPKYLHQNRFGCFSS